MRKLIALAATGAIVLVAIAQSNGGDLLAGYTKALSDAKSLTTTYTFQRMEDPVMKYTVTLSKPNLARIESGNELIIADGKTITTYDKDRKVYFKSGQSEASLNELFKRQELSLWAPFFNSKAFAGMTGKTLAAVNRKGVALNTVEVPLNKTGDKVAKIYLNQQDNVARQAEITLTKGSKKDVRILDTKSLTLDGTVTDAMFAFAAPAGSKEISAEELNADRWFTNLDEAKSTASKTGKKIFVDFMATWCGPCKMLEAQVFTTEEFKKLGKHFVFLKIDVDAQPDVSQMYKVEAMPTQLVLDKDGAVLGTKVGYANPADFFQFINAYAN